MLESHGSEPCASACCATSAWSLSSVPIRAVCPYEGRVGAGPKGVAGNPGFEPRPTGPEPAVLPLHQLPSSTGGATRTRNTRGLSSRPLPIGLHPRASPGTRTPCLRIKSPALHLYSSRRSEPHRRVELRSPVWRTGTSSAMLMRRGSRAGTVTRRETSWPRSGSRRYRACLCGFSGHR
jgi:hypothetical protein